MCTYSGSPGWKAIKSWSTRIPSERMKACGGENERRAEEERAAERGRWEGSRLATPNVTLEKMEEENRSFAALTSTEKQPRRRSHAHTSTSLPIHRCAIDANTEQSGYT